VAGQVVVELTAQDKISGVLNKINATSKNLQKNLGGAVNRVRGSFKKLQGQAVSLQGALGSLAIGAVVKGFADAGVQADRTAKRLKFLGDQFGESAKLQEFANEAAEKFTLGQTDAANAVGDLFGRLRPMGTSLDDIKTVFNGVNVAAKQMNLSTAETEGVMLQLSQALGSGKLQGDEFRSIMERLPKIGQAVAQSMGVTVGQLKNLSSQGKLTTDVIINALKGIENQGFPPSDGVREFNKAMSDLSTTIGQRLTPILDPILKGIAGLVGKFLELPEPVQAAVIGFTAVATAFAAIAPLLPVIATGIGAVVAVLTGPVGIVAGITAVVAAFVTMKGKAEEAKQPVNEVKKETDQLKEATEAAAVAKQKFIDNSKAALQSVQQEQQQIQQAEQAYTNSLNLSNARLEAEAKINEMQNQSLQIAYEQATSAGQRLQIAQQIFQNEIESAKIAHQQTLLAIEAEQRKLEFKRQGAEIEARMIEAKGMLAAAEADSAEKAALITQRTQEAVNVQRENIKLIDSQIATQAKIAEQQTIGANAQLKMAQMTAQQKLKQKLVSDEIGISNQQANELASRLGESATSSFDLANGTQSTAQAASQSAQMFIQVANNASAAASAISRAAAAQRELNAAKAAGGKGGGGGPVAFQAQGGYNLGSFKAFARGGVVKGPTLGLIGEGGEPEYIIPQSKAAGFSANYLAGKRGISAVPGFAAGGVAMPSSANVSIQTGPVTQMNGANFVTTQDMSAAVQAGVEQTLEIIRQDNMVRAGLGI